MASEGDNPAVSDAVQELVDQLVARSETRGDSCVELSELSELIQEADLGDEDAQIVHDMLQELGLDLRTTAGGSAPSAVPRRRSTSSCARTRSGGRSNSSPNGSTKWPSSVTVSAAMNRRRWSRPAADWGYVRTPFAAWSGGP